VCCVRIGELCVRSRNAYAARTPSVVVAAGGGALEYGGMIFTSGLAEVPHVWVGRGPRLIESLEDLKKALSAASDGAVVAALQAPKGFSPLGLANRDTSVQRNRPERNSKGAISCRLWGGKRFSRNPARK